MSAHNTETLTQQRDRALGEARALLEASDHEQRAFTPDETARFDELMQQHDAAT